MTFHDTHESPETEAPRRTGGSRVVAMTAAVVMAAFLAGCGGTAQSGTGALTIQTPWAESDPYYAPFQEIVAEFEDSHPEIEVEVTATDTDNNQRIFINKVLADEAPDIIVTNPVRDALSWIEQGATVPVSDYLDEWGLREAIHTEAQEEVNWLTGDGELRGFPLVGFVWPTWYHSADLETVGGSAPATGEDVERYLGALGGKDSVIVGGSDWSGFNAFMQTLQAYLSDDELNELCAVGGWSANAEARKGVEWFVELRDRGFWSPNSTGQTVDGANAAFQGDQASGITLISDFFGDVPDDLAAEVTLGGIPIPSDANVDKPVVMAAYTASGVMISVGGQENNLEAVKAFVQYLYQPESIAKFVDQAGMVAAAEYDTSAPVTNAMLAQANSPEFRDAVTFVGASNIPTEIVENLTRAASVAWTTNATVDGILDAMDAVY